MRSILLGTLFLTFAFSTFAQLTPESNKWSVHVGSMFNNLIHPGFNVGFEYGLADKVVLKSKVKPGKGAVNMTKVHQAVFGMNTGFIWHPKTSTTLLHNYTLEYRKTSKHRMQYQLGFGLGYARSFVPNSYSVDNDGNVKKTFLGSSGYFAPGTFIGFGRFRKDARKLQWWHLRINTTYLVAYNGVVIPYLTSEIRLGFHKKPTTR